MGGGTPPGSWLGDHQAVTLVQEALGLPPSTVQRRALTESGNAVFRADLPDGRSVVLRVSPRSGTFACTGSNLSIRSGWPAGHPLLRRLVGPRPGQRRGAGRGRAERVRHLAPIVKHLLGVAEAQAGLGAGG
jgi:hypothetical protein